MSEAAPNRDIFSVSRLAKEVRFALERGFPLLWVQGEIGNLTNAASGHSYFNLKDDQAQVRCAMFRARRQLLRFVPKSGDQVLVRARISFYEARGEFQLVIEHMEPAGEGALRQALEALKQKLAAEGLFDESRKQPLPALPATIGILSSPKGAAVHDVLSVLARRYPLARVILYPIPVQGQEAPAAIVEMLKIANARREADVLILTRGGGSLEDLMAFNDEQVARALARVEIPCVSAIGHEIDFIITDLVADKRAATPSAAAELVSPDQGQLVQLVNTRAGQLMERITQRLIQASERHAALEQRLTLSHPLRRLQQQMQRLDELDGHLQMLMRHRQQNALWQFESLQQRLLACHPGLRLEHFKERLDELLPRLRQAQRHLLENKALALGATARALQAISPLATLDRGYALARREDGRIIRDAKEVQPGERLSVQLAKGAIEAEVVHIRS
jgi:exodeoxyribonuclease VII large subunit